MAVNEALQEEEEVPGAERAVAQKQLLVRMGPVRVLVRIPVPGPVPRLKQASAPVPMQGPGPGARAMQER